MYSGNDPHRWGGCPIRISTDQSLLAAPHGFSQRATSFIASWCQGIHRMPLIHSILQCARPRDTAHTARPDAPSPRQDPGSLQNPAACPPCTGTIHRNHITIARPATPPPARYEQHNAKQPDKKSRQTNRARQTIHGTRTVHHKPTLPSHASEHSNPTAITAGTRVTNRVRQPFAAKSGPLPKEQHTHPDAPKPIHPDKRTTLPQTIGREQTSNPRRPPPSQSNAPRQSKLISPYKDQERRRCPAPAGAARARSALTYDLPAPQASPRPQ